MDDINEILQTIETIKRTKTNTLHTLKNLNKTLFEYEMRYFLLVKKLFTSEMLQNDLHTKNKIMQIEKKIKRKLLKKSTNQA